MIAYISGILKSKQEGEIVVDSNGIGYQIFVSTNTLSFLPNQNDEVEIYTYLHLREDGVILYGFSSMEEKQLFLKLITVSDIGPKKAMGILSGMNLSDLMIAIATSDVKQLSKIKGLGAKTAERLCLELKDKINVLGSITYQEKEISSVVGQAIETLISLGVNKVQATDIVKSVAKDEYTLEELVTHALQNMGR